MSATHKDVMHDPQTLSKEQPKGLLLEVQHKQRGGSRAEYATYADFCGAFARDMKQVYLLAFLLTANHLDAEKSFAIALEEIPTGTVFKDCVSSWIRRCLIQTAIYSILQQPRDDRRANDEWWGEQTTAVTLINAVTRLASLERFVFVMSVLEGYSIKECSLLLDCTEPAVIKTRIRALRELPLLQCSDESSLSDSHTGEAASTQSVA